MKGSQELDLTLIKLKKDVIEGKNIEFSVSSYCILHCRGRLCVPEHPKLRNQILSEAHSTLYSVHPSTTNMYIDLKEHF